MNDLDFIGKTIELALEAEKKGNLPIASIIVLDDKIISVGMNSIFNPCFAPLKHGEINALDGVDCKLLLNRSKDMTLYTNIEPCIMCFGALVLHKIGRVVYGGSDPNKGATFLKDELEKIYNKESLPIFEGPILQDVCGPMWKRANVVYRNKLNQPYKYR